MAKSLIKSDETKPFPSLTSLVSSLYLGVDLYFHLISSDTGYFILSNGWLLSKISFILNVELYPTRSICQHVLFSIFRQVQSSTSIRRWRTFTLESRANVQASVQTKWHHLVYIITPGSIVVVSWIGGMDWLSICSRSREIMSQLCATLLYDLPFDSFISYANMKIAPILNDIDTSYQPVMFNGSFMKENAFRLKAGPEVDAAWGSLGVHCKYHCIYASIGSTQANYP